VPEVTLKYKNPSNLICYCHSEGTVYKLLAQNERNSSADVIMLRDKRSVWGKNKSYYYTIDYRLQS
jgi:hypothetical protein